MMNRDAPEPPAWLYLVVLAILFVAAVWSAPSHQCP